MKKGTNTANIKFAIGAFKLFEIDLGSVCYEKRKEQHPRSILQKEWIIPLLSTKRKLMIITTIPFLDIRNVHQEISHKTSIKRPEDLIECIRPR